MAKLARLTAEQEALIPVVRDEWLGHGLSTDPADRAEAERGVRLAYEAVGLAAPSIVVWLDSPLTGTIGQWMIRQLPDHQDQVWGQVRGQVRDQVGGQVWGQVWGQVGGQVGDAIWGQHDAGYYGWADFWRRAGLTGLDAIEGQTVVARNAGWWWPLQGAVVLTDRPMSLHRDDRGRLHHEDGPALLYRDGWGVWAWHGQRVPQWVIEAPTPERISAEDNIEIRRCAIESYGWERLVSDWTPVDECDDPGNAPHRLRLYDVPRRLWGDDARVLLCINGTPEADGTPRRYGLTVPAHMERALQAAAASYRLSEDEYATLGRRA